MGWKQTDLPDHMPTTFGTGFDHVLQQTESRLFACAQPVSFTGKKRTFNKLNTAKANKIVNRKGDTEYQKEDYEYLTMDACSWDVAHCFDEFDPILLGEVGMPTSDIVQAHVAAYNRSKDEVFLRALGGSVFGGAEGRNECPLPNTQRIAVDYNKDGTVQNTGLTVDKILRALELLGKAEAYGFGNMGMGRPKLVLNQCMMTQLMCEDKLLNGDYISGKPMDTGYMSSVLGVDIIRTELLPTDAVNDIARAYIWIPSAMRTVEQKDRETHFDVIPEKRHALQIRSVWRNGAMRYEDKGVVEIYVDQSPAV